MKWLAALALLIAAAVAGYAYHGEQEADAIATAKSSYDVCSSALEGNKASLDDVRKTLSEVRERHDKALEDARKVLEERDVEIQSLHAAAEKSAASIRKSAHDDANCVALARMPVCAAMARQLWPDAIQARSDRDAN